MRGFNVGSPLIFVQGEALGWVVSGYYMAIKGGKGELQ